MILAFTVAEWGILFGLLATTIIFPVVQMILAAFEKQSKLTRDEQMASNIAATAWKVDHAADERARQSEAIKSVAKQLDRNTEVTVKTADESAKIAANVQTIETATNHMKDALVEATRAGAERKGADDERLRNVAAQAAAIVAQNLMTPQPAVVLPAATPIEKAV